MSRANKILESVTSEKLTYYHITTKDRVKDIITSGLKINSKKNSYYDDLGGIYLTSDWNDLLFSHVVPELSTHNKDNLWLFEVNISGLDDKLKSDPEFDNVDPNWIKICTTNIEPSRLKLVGRIYNEDRRWKLDKSDREYS